jgi:uncharacterized protein involved in exopolysaccharide biosynthesis/Mrp family chromosome partitioning ATPase
MFNLVPPVSGTYSQVPNGMSEDRPLELRQLLHFLQSNALLIFAITSIFVIAAVAYLLVVPATYTSAAQVILDPPTSGSSADNQQLRTEEAFVEGQIEIMGSTDVLRSVVRSLALGSDPEFISTRFSPSDLLRSMAFNKTIRESESGDDEIDEARENLTIAILRGRLWIRRVGQSSVLDIAASSTSPAKAALIANAVAEAYMVVSLNSRSMKARHASEWLAERVSLIKQDVFAAERAVKEFQVSGSPESRFRLAQLQSEADSYRKVYESYLQRWFETAQQISNPVGEARFISRAATPVTKSQPKSALLLGFFLFLGFGAGLVVATIRHFTRRAVSSADQINSALKLPCLGLIAKVPRAKAAKPDDRSESGRIAALHTSSFERDVKDLKAAITGLRRAHKSKLIGVIGIEPRAGATSLVYHVGQMAAAAGTRTLVIDAAAANPTLSNFAGQHGPSLMDLLNNHDAYPEFIRQINGDLTVLPIGRFGRVTPGDRIGSEQTALNLADLRERFDLILIDLPPLQTSTDAKSIAPHLDGLIAVARHGITPFLTLSDVIRQLRTTGAELLGIVLNASPQPKKTKWRPS